MSTVTVAPSMLCTDYRHVEEDIRIFEASPAIEMLHIDVMDGHYVPNLGLGPSFVAALRAMTEMPIDAHLMCSEPQRLVRSFIDAGATRISVHVEADPHLDRALNLVKSCGATPGVAINPSTPLVSLEYALEVAEYVLLMCVNPGFPGQTLVPYTIDKIAALAEMVKTYNHPIEIMVDGNVTYERIPPMVRAGATILVSGTGCVFRKDRSVSEAIRALEAVFREDIPAATA